MSQVLGARQMIYEHTHLYSGSYKPVYYIFLINVHDLQGNIFGPNNCVGTSAAKSKKIDTHLNYEVFQVFEYKE